MTCQFTVTVGDVGSILFFTFYILGLFSLVTYVLVICGHKMIMTSNQAGFIILNKPFNLWYAKSVMGLILDTMWEIPSAWYASVVKDFSNSHPIISFPWSALFPQHFKFYSLLRCTPLLYYILAKNRQQFGIGLWYTS